MSLTSYEKNRIALRARLGGQGYFKALKAMNFAEGYHTGFRKDGVTPEFSHQVSIVAHLTTLPAILYPEDTFTVGFLHDVCEDYDVAYSVIAEKFGERVERAVHALTKEHLGIKRAPAEVAAAQGEDPIASLVKGCDRVHNHQSMPGVFNEKKIQSYLEETSTYILPMLKVARRNFPEQQLSYESLKYSLVSQMELLEAALSGVIKPA